MKSRTKQRRTTRICAVISAGMMLVIGLPACTNASMPAPRSAEHETPTVEHAGAAVPEPMMTPLVLGDETSKSLPVEQYEEPAGAYASALYLEEPMASGYVPVADTEGLWKACQNQLKECTEPCKRKKSDKAKMDCYVACNAKYYACLQLVGLAKTFDALDKAWSWIKDNKVKVVGTIIIVGGIAYVVSTGGAGALVLIPLAA